MDNKDVNCADCGGFDVEWMSSCPIHKGVETCRGCECPYCEDDWDCWVNDEVCGCSITPPTEENKDGKSF